jgi:hypothetical protein
MSVGVVSDRDTEAVRRLDQVPRSAVTIDDDFWGDRRETLRETTLEYVHGKLEGTGRVDNFRVAAGEVDGEFSGKFYNDSDVYKWLEAASDALASGLGDEDLRERVDDVVAAVAAAQAPDGYLNTYFQLVEPDGRWSNLHRMHELYCAGHLIEAAVAHRDATGEEDLLDVATAFADLIDDRFGPEGVQGYPGHEELELALVRLYRATGERRYLDLASYFVEERGAEDSPFEREVRNPDDVAGEVMTDYVLDEAGNYDGSYMQDQAPVRGTETIEGHSVRATYLYAGATDVAVETDDRDLLAAVERVWRNMTERRSYVTGGIGSAYGGERFTEDYDLPNRTAYAETCAALGSVRWNHRLLRATGEARFADVLERTLYNGFLVGVSLSGDRFFYVNPLRVDPEEGPEGDYQEHFATERREWFGTACCPTNVPRLLAGLERYLFLVDRGADAVTLPLHVGSEAEVSVGGGDVHLDVETAYPWEGETTVTVGVDEPTSFGLRLRVPPWSAGATLSVDGEVVGTDLDAGFVGVERAWTGGETVALSFDLPVRTLAAHPAVDADEGRVAVERGPLVYCVEDVDNPAPLARVQLPAGAAADATTSREPDLLDGVTTVSLPGRVLPEGDALYRATGDLDATDATVTAIPYYAWGHRDGAEMRVWLPTTVDPAGRPTDAGPRGSTD